MTPQKACQVIYVCCWLHNKALDYGYVMDLDSIDNEEEQDPLPRQHDDPIVTERQSVLKGKTARVQLIRSHFTYL